MKKLILAATLVCASVGANAGIINGDFENGLTGWQTDVGTVGLAAVYGGELYMTSNASISQSLAWNQGDEISFDYLLDFTEELNSTISFNDFALFWLDDEYGNKTVEITIGDVIDHISIESTFTYVFEQTANGAFNIGIFDQFDMARNSRIKIDNVTFEGSGIVDVPEPSTMAILGLGLLGLGARRFTS